MVFGDISGILDTLEWAPNVTMANPQPVWMQGIVVAIAHTSTGNVGQLTTVEVDATGNFNGTIDTVQFDTLGFDIKALKISDTVIALWYRGPDVDGWVRTITINTDGTIGATIDTLEFDTVRCLTPYPVRLEDGIYGVAYQGPDGDGWIATHTIDSSGNIGAANIDTHEFQSTFAVPRSFITIDGTVRAITYRDTDVDGWLITLDIAASGEIGAVPIIDSWEFEASLAVYPRIDHLIGTEYLLSWVDVDNDGQFGTLTIADNGTITKSFNATREYDTSDSGGVYSLLNLGVNDDGDVVIAYTHLGTNEGRIRTDKIAADGTLISVVDTLSVDVTSAGSSPWLARLAAGADYYVCAFGDIDGDGDIISCTIVTPPPPPSAVYPTHGLTRVTGLIHRYDRRKGIYNLEMSLGDTTSRVALASEGSARPASTTQEDLMKSLEAINKEITERPLPKINVADTIINSMLGSAATIDPLATIQSRPQLGAHTPIPSQGGRSPVDRNITEVAPPIEEIAAATDLETLPWWKAMVKAFEFNRDKK